jgi:peptidoglycan hydrolase CwlO-like protein
MTVELKSWQQQESTYQKLIHEFAESSKKAGESIPETKEKIKRLQGKIETANKDINEVRYWLLRRNKIAASRVLTDFFD